MVSSFCGISLIMEYLVKVSKRRTFWSLNEDILKNTVLTTNTPYPSRKIRHICACTHQSPRSKQDLYAFITRSSTNKLFSPFENPEREFRSSRRLFKTLSLDESRTPRLNLFSDLEDYSGEEVAKIMAETMEQYMSKTRADYGSGVARPKIEEKDSFEIKGQFLKELCTNTFSGSDHEDSNEHIEKVLEIVDLFHIPNITIDQVMLRAFPMSLTGASSRWLRNKPIGSITTWTKFLSKYCPPARITNKMKEINNFQQEPDKNLYQAWERFKELLMKCPQHYLTEMQEVVLFYNGLDVPTRQILDSIEIKKVNEKVYVAQVGCEQCKGPHYTKDCPLKEEGKTLEEAYYTQFGKPFQGGGYIATAPGFYQRNNTKPSYQERRQSMEDTLSKFMGESAKRHEENSNLIKEIRASTDAAIRNQGASIKTLEIQIGKMSNVLQERGFGSLPSSTETNPRDQVKSISTTVVADVSSIRRASVSVMPLLTYLNLGLGELAHTKLTVELADRTVKYPKGIAENVLVGIGKFTFPVDFIILDMPEDIKVPLILRRPFLSTAHAKIDVYKRKITLRVGEERIVFTSVKPASSLIKRVYMLSLRERMELDLEARLMGETLVLNRSLDPFLEDYIELNDLNEPFELRRNQGFSQYFWLRGDMDLYYGTYGHKSGAGGWETCFAPEFPAIVYNDALTSKLDFLTEPTVSSNYDELLKDETSLSECDEEEQNVLNFNDLFPFNVIYPNDSKSDKDNDDNKVDIKHSSGIYLSNHYLM
ncbi:DNA-directed DNA polymerase [Tanacetum coccineum]